jgi:acetyl esterase/lipase
LIADAAEVLPRFPGSGTICATYYRPGVSWEIEHSGRMLMNQIRRISLIAFLLVAIAVIAGAARGQQRNGPSRDIRFLQDVSYDPAPDADPKYQVSDLYLPAGKKNFPMLFFIHGGGWRAGDKVYDGLDHIVNICYDLGIGVMSINYRMGKNIGYQTEMRDTAMAFAWLYKNGAQYGADTNTIFVMGGSAGAHMAALFAADPRYLQEQGLSPKNIKGVMLSSGLYDMGSVFTLGGASGNIASATAAEKNSALGMPAALVRDFFGNDYNQLRDAGAAAYIGKTKDLPPYLIAYTDDDIFSLAQQATGFYDLFLQHHLPAILVEQPGRTHPTKTSGINEKLKGADDVLGPAMKNFMQSVLAGTFGDTDSAVWAAKGAAAPDMKLIKDLRYDTSASSDAKLNSLDLYVPAGKQNVPLIFYVHGGGWRAGDKANPTTLVNTFGRMGVGLASVNYRLAPDVKHPGEIEDVAKAFGWIYKNAQQYGIDRNRMVIAGASAGGHLVSLLALNPEYLSKESVPSDAIKGVASISGIYDLAAWPEPGMIPTRKEQAFGIDPAVLREASPSTYVTAKAPPFLITFTDWDLFMIRENTLEMYNLMLNKGANVQMVMVPGRTHMGIAEIGTNANQIDDVLGPALARFVADQLHLHHADSNMAMGQ